MVDNSVGDLLDMGSSTGCEKIGNDIAKYVVMNIGFTNSISSFKVAYCLPV